MKKAVVFALLLGAASYAYGQGLEAITDSLRQGRGDGILKSIENASVSANPDYVQVVRKQNDKPIVVNFADCQGVGIDREQDQWWVLPINTAGARITVNTNLWLLPQVAASKNHSWYLQFPAGKATAVKTAEGMTVRIDSDSFRINTAEARPHSDTFNHRFSLHINGGPELEDALAAFYWGTILPSVVEKTMAANFPYHSGYVLSTLKTSAYAGSYPAVDHEFQIKGRLAMGSELDLAVVRRMIELQFKLMQDDPERLSRAPTSVQPDGRREYHIRRNSKNNKENAAMFPLTGDIEVIEESWHYYEATKDKEWLAAHIANLEAAAAWTQAHIDQYGRVWSDVYYEDQVMKDGRETEAQAFAAYTFGLLARMEALLKQPEKSATYVGVSKKISAALIEPLPMGYWDEKNQRFIDWVDRNGKTHDHVALLANVLPVTFGYATKDQASAVLRMVEANAGQFERFPSFLAADIAGYDNSEIGDGGPYDLCAAGRYWYWDAAYRESLVQDDLLLHQLKTVAAEAAKENYFMGERYDMDHVYYIDGKNAHGAEKYYEYPNVYAAVLISKLLGLTVPVDADVSVAPHIEGYGTVEVGVPAYAVRYTYSDSGFALKNLSNNSRSYSVDLSALDGGKLKFRPTGKVVAQTEAQRFTVTLAPQEEAHWNLTR